MSQTVNNIRETAQSDTKNQIVIYVITITWISINLLGVNLVTVVDFCFLIKSTPE